MIPFGSAIRRCRLACVASSRPSLVKSSSTRVRSRILITTLSPNTVGKVETRMSISTPRTTVLMRPSCGSRRSAISSLAMILMRVVSAARSVAGTSRSCCRNPSMRYRTATASRPGSMCTSDAPRSTALAMIWLTSRMTGASLAISRSRSTSNSLPSPLASASAVASSAVRLRHRRPDTASARRVRFPPARSRQDRPARRAYS